MRCWHGLSSLQADGAWHFSSHGWPQLFFGLLHACSHGLAASSQSPGLWHCFWHVCEPQRSLRPQIRPQRASVRKQGWFLRVVLPHMHSFDTRNGHLGQGSVSAWQVCGTWSCRHGFGRSHWNRHGGGDVPQGRGGCSTVRPQWHASSSKMASRQEPHGPLWQSSWQAWFPHFSVRPQTRVQICSASIFSSRARGVAPSGRSLRFAACRSVALRSPGQQCSSQVCRPQLSVARHTLVH